VHVRDVKKCIFSGNILHIWNCNTYVCLDRAHLLGLILTSETAICACSDVRKGNFLGILFTSGTVICACTDVRRGMSYGNILLNWA
jgi:hypothetical protein